ncbi:MAG: hypothetical protein PVH00_13985 [Gemmatimonadota bacterium]|jgi:hypothetical protein
MSTLAIAEQQYRILASLRQLGGRATSGDVAAGSGLDSADVRRGLKTLLASHRGHLEVSDSGELLYQFDPRFIKRGTEPLLARAKRAVSSFLARAFRIWIVVMLVVYFVIFVALVIAALLASQRDGQGGGRRGRRWGGRGGGGMPNFFFWYWIWGPRWRLGRPYYGHRWERTLAHDDTVPFYKKVFAFVFGPDRPRPTQEQRDRDTLRLIRSRQGVLTAAELIEHRALTRPEAEEELGRLMGAHDGEALVSPDGVVVYAFPALMTSAHGPVRVRPPNPSWMRLEYPLELTGNTKGTNAAVAGMNGFTLAAAATAPWFIFPRLGIGGPAAVWGLMVVPIIFSALFFGVPLVRRFWIRRENRRREARNLRRVLLGYVYARVLAGGAVGLTEAHLHVSDRLENRAVTRDAVEAALHALAAEFDGHVTTADDGNLWFRFDAIHRQYAAGETVRNTLRLENRTLGEIVYSTADTAREAEDRELALFDRKLEGDEALRGYLPSVDRVAYEDDFEVVASG